MQRINDATIAIIVNSSALISEAAEQIALGVYDRLKGRSDQADEIGEKRTPLENQCIENVAEFVRAMTKDIGNPDAQARLSEQLGAFGMQRSGYAAAGDSLKPVFKDVLGEQGTDRLCAAWGDAYWRIASPLVQSAR